MLKINNRYRFFLPALLLTAVLAACETAKELGVAGANAAVLSGLIEPAIAATGRMDVTEEEQQSFDDIVAHVNTTRQKLGNVDLKDKAALLRVLTNGTNDFQEIADFYLAMRDAYGMAYSVAEQHLNDPSVTANDRRVLKRFDEAARKLDDAMMARIDAGSFENEHLEALATYGPVVARVLISLTPAAPLASLL